jgi:hypothetical protein
MEIREYIRTKRRWLLPLVAVPVVAGAVTAFVLAGQTPETTARVQVQVPTEFANSDSQIGLHIARFSEGLNLATVQKQIIEASGIRRGQLNSLRVERRGQSDQFNVTLTSTTGPERTLAAAETAAKVGSVWVAEQSARSSAEALEAARATFDQAQSALFAYQDEIGDLDPNVTYAAVTRSLLNPGNASIESLRAQQEELVGQIRRMNELKSSVGAASSLLGQASAASARDRAKVAAAQSGEQILQSNIVPQSTLRPIIEGAGVAAVVAFLAVLGLSLLPDVLTRKRSRSREERPVPATAVAAPEPGSVPAQQGATAPPNGWAEATPAGSARSDVQARVRPSPRARNGVPVHSPSGSEPA